MKIYENNFDDKFSSFNIKIIVNNLKSGKLVWQERGGKKGRGREKRRLIFKTHEYVLNRFLHVT